MLCKKFTKFTGKHLCQGLRSATLLKKSLWHRCFPVNFVKFLRTLFSKEHLWKLLLFILVVFKYIKKWIVQKVMGVLTQFRLNYMLQCRFRRCSKIENKFEFIVEVKIWCLRLVLSVFRSIHQRCSIKKVVLKNVAIFIGKHLSWSLFLIKLQAIRPETLLKRDSNTVIFMWILWNF